MQPYIISVLDSVIVHHLICIQDHLELCHIVADVVLFILVDLLSTCASSVYFLSFSFLHWTPGM